MEEIPEDVYGKIYHGEKVECIYNGCKGHLKKIKEYVKFHSKKYNEKSLICRCTHNCKHRFVLIKNNLSSKLVLFKL